MWLNNQSVDLRCAIHEILQRKEDQLRYVIPQCIVKVLTDAHRELREKHGSSLGEFYHFYSRKRPHGSAFPSIDLEDVGLEDGFGSFEQWKLSAGLDIEYVFIITQDRSREAHN